MRVERVTGIVVMRAVKELAEIGGCFGYRGDGRSLFGTGIMLVNFPA